MSEKPKILYVDDEEINLQVFKASFSKYYDVLVAESGKEGLEILRDNQNIKFIISDMKMPEMNGLEFIQEAKKIKNEIPCMILSGYQQTQAVNEAIKNGLIVDYMMKPLNKPSLEELIAKHVNNASA